MKSEDCVAILLASYNGANYISDQIESILAQTHSDFHLFIQDDGSSDGTAEIVARYAAISERITQIKNVNPGMGPAINFGGLMEWVKKVDRYKYIMFSDQDDIWNNNKVQLSLQAIIEQERTHTNHEPILVHTDFQYVDAQLNPIFSKSNVAKKISNHRNKILLLANDNYIFGCTIIINKSLLTLSVPISPHAENHDYWIALHAATFGTIFFADFKTMCYRQHHNNVTGGIAYSSFWRRLKRLTNLKIYIKQKNVRLAQFEAFIRKNDSILSTRPKRLFLDYILFSKKGGAKAVLFMIKHGFSLRGVPQTMLYYVSLFVDKGVTSPNRNDEL